MTTNRHSNEFRKFSSCNCLLMLETFLFQCVHNSHAVPYTLFNNNNNITFILMKEVLQSHMSYRLLTPHQ